ncbi:MAG: hypothetical protein K6G16_03280 [Lachnospiraceae bacterium]|nr:hypothetical protein [Lachnospiraceae bacterium]
MKRAFCKFHRNCRFGGEISEKWREKARILRGKGGVFSYCILSAENPSEQLEIVNSAFLCSSRCRKNPPTVYGVARTRRGAFALVAQIFNEAARAGMPGEAGRFVLSDRF